LRPYAGTGVVAGEARGGGKLHVTAGAANHSGAGESFIDRTSGHPSLYSAVA